MSVLDEMLEAENNHDVDQAAACFTDDCFFEDVPFGMKANGKGELKDSMRMWFAAAPDAHARIISLVTDGNQASAEVIVTGTHLGDMPQLPRTGKTFEIRAVSFFELQGGKIKRRTDYWDSTSLLRQLGAMP